MDFGMLLKNEEGSGSGEAEGAVALVRFEGDPHFIPMFGQTQSF